MRFVGFLKCIAITLIITGCSSDNESENLEVVDVEEVKITDVVGDWGLIKEEGALAVGPTENNLTWWSSSAADVVTRACLFDDVYRFSSDGTFTNVLGNQTWGESWIGKDPEGCTIPVAPFDGTAKATWSHNEIDQTITISGKGAFLGLSKVADATELTSVDDAAENIRYKNVSFSSDKSIMTVQVTYGSDGRTWQFQFSRIENSPI